MRLKTLVILPGMDGTGKLFGPLKKVLPAGWITKILAYPQNEILSLEVLASRLRVQLPAREPFVLIAESFGGLLGIKIAGHPPANLQGLVLSAAFASRPTGPLLAQLRYFVGPRLVRAVPPGALMKYLLAGHDCPSALQRLSESAILSVSPKVLLHRLSSALDSDLRKDLKKCPVPVLYLQAKDDRLVRSASFRVMQKVRPDIEGYTIDAPHFLLQLAPARAWKVISQFIRRLPRPETL